MKERLTEHRDDWSGGLNTAVSPEKLQSNELVLCQNARLDVSLGAIAKRSGSRKMHATAIGSGNPVTGLVQWDAPSGKQLVAVSNGKIYHKTSDFGNFTEVTPDTAFQTGTKQSFTTGRQNVSGAPLRLYIADGAYQRWTESAITDLSGTSSLPSAVDLVENYHVRAFLRNPLYPQNARYTPLGDPEDGSTGLGTSGGDSMVQHLRGEAIQAMATIGSSLVFATEDSLARFTGYSSEDIRLYQDTEGISTRVGTFNRNTLKEIDKHGVTWCDIGVYGVDESQVTPLSVKIDPTLHALDRSSILTNSCVGFHKGRKEIWFALDDTVYILTTGAIQAWQGPFTYPFDITCLASWEDSSGDEWIVAGCSDGYVRHLDSGALDDQSSTGTGGSRYTMLAELSPIFFETGPYVSKTLERIYVQGDIQEGYSSFIEASFDGDPWTSLDIQSVADVVGIDSYRLDIGIQGKRLRIRIKDASASIPIIHGLSIQAFDMKRMD